MQKLRDFIKRNPLLWIASLVPALIVVLAAQLHIHVHEHQHESGAVQHSHDKAHSGNVHEAGHGIDQHHSDAGVITVDISPEALGKILSSLLSVIALIALVILFYPPLLHLLRLNRFTVYEPLNCWCNGSLPPLRAPPL